MYIHMDTLKDVATCSFSCIQGALCLEKMNEKLMFSRQEKSIFLRYFRKYALLRYSVSQIPGNNLLYFRLANSAVQLILPFSSFAHQTFDILSAHHW